MNKNVELLNYIFQNSQMGLDTISHLMNVTEDTEYKNVLESQYKEYDKIFQETKGKLDHFDKEGKDISFYQKATADMMINFKTITDKSPSHISEMLIQGSTMGVIDSIKKLKEYKDADTDILGLGQRLLEFEEANIEQCKKYL
jgi:transcriptional regulator with PAS, ATPase and Fis domain